LAASDVLHRRGHRIDAEFAPGGPVQNQSL
jgi:hypothetical protein